MPILEHNKAIARRWFEEVINQRRPEAVDDVYLPEYVHHGTGGQDIGLEGARAAARRLLAASADRHATVLDQVAEEDRVTTRWESVGTFSGGKRATVRGIVISRIDHGRIAEEWEVVDHLSLLRDLAEMPRESE